MTDAKQHTKSAHLDLIDSIIRNHKNYSNTTSTVYSLCITIKFLKPTNHIIDLTNKFIATTHNIQLITVIICNYMT